MGVDGAVGREEACRKRDATGDICIVRSPVPSCTRHHASAAQLTRRFRSAAAMCDRNMLRQAQQQGCYDKGAKGTQRVLRVLKRC